MKEVGRSNTWIVTEDPKIDVFTTHHFFEYDFSQTTLASGEQSPGVS